jgi:hypothetical protein
MADDKKKKKGGSVLKLLLLLIVVVAVAFVGYGMTLDTKYHFERSVVIKADKDDIHEWVGDIRKWDEWGPWREEDPAMKITYGEKTEGVGASESWEGEKIGKGKLEFTAADPETGIKYKLQISDFPWTSGEVRYEDAPEGATKVTWTFDSEPEVGFFSRYFYTFGGDSMNEMFEKGLSNLKTKVEAK